MSTQTVDTVFLARGAQAVLHETIGDRRAADTLGRQIAEWAAAHWERVVSLYGTDAEDDLEVVERVTRDLLAHKRITALPGR
jgi:hypothetical protein